MVQVNGKQQEFTPSMTIVQLLEQLNYPITRVAIEQNGRIVPRKMLKETMIEDGDVLEVVSFVGGG